MDKTSTTPPVNETDLLHIPPVPPPPPPLLTEDQYGDPYELPREISESIRPLLVISGRATSSEILPILERIHPLLVAYVEEIKNRKQRDNRMGVLLRQTCYYFASQLPLRHHNMKEWSIWVPAADDYDSLGPEKAIGETELFDSTHRYKRREAQYLSYKTEWLKLNDAYKNAVEKRDKAIAAREKVERDRLAAELEAKKKLEKERKQSAGDPQFKFDSKSTPAKNNRKVRQFKVQTPESIHHQLTLKRPSQFHDDERSSKVPRLDAQNPKPILLPQANDESFSSVTSFDPNLLSRIMDLGCPDSRGRQAVAVQVAQIQHCESVVFDLSQIVSSEVRSMEILISNLLSSLISIRRDGPKADMIPVLTRIANDHPLLRRWIGAGLLDFEEPDLALEYTSPPATDHDQTSSALSSDQSAEHSPDREVGSNIYIVDHDDKVLKSQ
ncbi:uncharacterized protein EV420DRAFT_1650440 [Desarmillaria tabescens]|uniref:Uncharacterized protein n=1 Tax=Armillaria tabescens TaxID=1929756 RepID=A0AA39MP75_ARMTA|nr:uncharacterized protein EV420DRAFT_1650440 [Desarmillaria tabescens]KAK0440690.1 hypothetical protein EV420DRAFT_1650440 [Desarmillaria tabescens]